jgi:phosphate starvation-inducible membrane PsiE
MRRAEELADKTEGQAEKVGNYLVDAFQLFALFAIGGTIVWSAIYAYMGMIDQGVATVDDILLLFIFLELGAMVGIYFKTNRLPVQFLLYVAITVMTRSLASSLTIKDMADHRMLAIAVAIFILAGAVFVLRFASHRFPPFVSHVESDQPTAPD